jgi:hypothetical protein
MFIWTAIMLRPLVLTWLHAGLAKATALLAAGRTPHYVPGQSTREL